MKNNYAIFYFISIPTMIKLKQNVVLLFGLSNKLVILRLSPAMPTNEFPLAVAVKLASVAATRILLV